MNRWNQTRARLIQVAFAALAGLSFVLPPAALAQGIQRDAPKDVVLGQLTLTAPPEVTMDGKPDRLSPGSRIRDLNNMLVLTGSAVGQTLPVVYRRDPAGLVHEVWILTEEEYSKLGGTSGSGAEGYKRFNELLALIFGARK
jgi:hypothetical protein